MTIKMANLTSLTSDELTFFYKMMVVHGEMPEFVEEPYSSPKKHSNQNPNHYNNKKKSKKSDRKKGKPRDKSMPDLYNLDDPLWKECTDEKFLAFRKIMIKLNE